MQDSYSSQEIQRLIEAKKDKKHLCLNGKYVDFNSEKCRDDIVRRIEDISHSRNDSSHRSDSRTYYTGVLRVLRRKLRDVEKELAAIAMAKAELAENKDVFYRRTSTNSPDAVRLLKLSGLL